jgi:hypothetical protein
MRFYLFFGIMLVNPVLAAMPNIECQFDTFLRVKIEGDTKLEAVAINQRMKISGGITDPKTLRLDGAQRATNSQGWSLGAVGLSNWETFETSFVGDYGDVLSISHGLGANKRPLKGRYKSTLVSPSALATNILIGNCVVG